VVGRRILVLRPERGSVVHMVVTDLRAAIIGSAGIPCRPAGSAAGAASAGYTGDRELLLRGAVAVQDLQARAVRGRAARRVEATARLRILQRAIGLRYPFLSADAVAIIKLYLRIVRRAVAVDVEAAAQRGERLIAAVISPVLIDRGGLAVP